MLERGGGRNTVEFLQDAVDGAGAAGAGHCYLEVVGVLGGWVCVCHCDFLLVLEEGGGGGMVEAV